MLILGPLARHSLFGTHAIRSQLFGQVSQAMFQLLEPMNDRMER